LLLDDASTRGSHGCCIAQGCRQTRFDVALRNAKAAKTGRGIASIGFASQTTQHDQRFTLHVMEAAALFPSDPPAAGLLRAEIAALKTKLAAETARCERLQSELDLRNSALDAASSHFVITDTRKPGTPTVYVNRAVAQACGYAPAEMLGMVFTDVFPRELNEVQFQRVMEALRNGREVSAELVARRKDGSTFWAGISLTFLRDAAGRVTHIVGVGADITARLEQQRAQRQLQDQLYREMQERERMAIELRLAQKLESVGRLAAGIAHEINTPIQYIGDSVSYLQSVHSDLDRLMAAYRGVIDQMVAPQDSLPALASVKEMENAIDLEFVANEVPKAFERTLQGVERVRTIVHAMKEFAHPDGSEHSSADLNHAIETTLTVAHNEYKYTAQVETRFGEIPLVICNVGEVNQVFLNLIVNAAHAIEQSGKSASNGRITIVTGVSGDSVVISFEDNGCGIPEAHLEKIFDPFFTTKPVGRGTGQGLAIARSIVAEKHGGSIDVHSVVGSGTRFVLRLPVAGRSPASTKR
jgi:PAS domain S-box-containing protein